jgi:hypothetical protein
MATRSELAVMENDNNCAVRAGTEEKSEVTPRSSGSVGEAMTSQEDLSEIVHGLNNVLVSILLNAQFMEWKLPSYSLMRRNTHEIQRSAKRAGVLLKRLTRPSGVGQQVATSADVL